MPLQATSGAASYDAFGGGVAAVPNYIEDVFSTWLYTGNGSTQTINNGIDLSGKGGLVWLKRRDAVRNHGLFDTVRGATKLLYSDLTNAEYTDAFSLTSFNSNGFSLGLDGGGNANGGTYASWTFREQPKFFDVVTYTGNGSNRTIAHNLGSVPGCIIVKRTSSAEEWFVYHRSTGASAYLVLNDTAGSGSSFQPWNNTAPTDTVFSLSNRNEVNQSGQTYVAYLFAHNAGGFGLTGTDNVITCGSFTTDGSGNATVDLGYEPQWILVKKTNAGDEANSGFWWMQDNMRGYPVRPAVSPYLQANTSSAETVPGFGVLTFPTSTGFVFNQNYSGFHNSNFIYIAIRRGPMKVPTTGTSVYNAISRTGTGAAATVTGAGFAPDLVVPTVRAGAYGSLWFDRLRGNNAFIRSFNTNAENTSVTDLVTAFGMDGVSLGADAGGWGSNPNAVNIINWFFRRAPGFFDEVCYTGTGSARTVAHNLTVVPELMIVKSRSTADSWPVYSAATGNSQNLFLNQTDAAASRIYWNNTTPTASVFSLGNSSVVSNSGTTYVAYLFATCPGVSKVGSYTGTGTAGNTVTTGFIPRFIMIKCTTTTGGWLVLDSARGLTSGNDPSLYLNSTAAEITNTDWVTVSSTGFQLNTTGNTSNGAGETYIYLAIA